ncbi:MAG: hypothetical protein QM704_00750 [Anaeromyxobacteraceae bacterium]
MPSLHASFIFVLDLSGPQGPATLAAFRPAIAPLVESRVNPDGRLGVVALHGRSADVAVPPTGSAERARRQLAGLPFGGSPSLAPGLRTALQLAAQEATRLEAPVPLLVLVSDAEALEIDAKALVPAARLAALGIPALVLDTAPRGPRARRASALRRVADAMRAPLLRPGGISTELLASTALNAAAIAARDDRWSPPRKAAARRPR